MTSDAVSEDGERHGLVFAHLDEGRQAHRPRLRRTRTPARARPNVSLCRLPPPQEPQTQPVCSAHLRLAPRAPPRVLAPARKVGGIRSAEGSEGTGRHVVGPRRSTSDKREPSQCRLSLVHRRWIETSQLNLAARTRDGQASVRLPSTHRKAAAVIATHKEEKGQPMETRS